MPEGPTVEEVLRANGVDGAWLIGIVRRALHDGLERRRAWLPEDRFEEAHGYLMLVACRAVVRYDPAYGQALSTFVYRRVRPRLVDWYRETLGDSRYPRSFAGKHALLFADRYEDELGDATVEDEYLTDELVEAEADLGSSLSEEARLGLHYAQRRAEGYWTAPERLGGHNGSGPRLTRVGQALEAARKELAPLVLQPRRPRRKRPPIRRAAMTGLVQKPPLLAIPDVSARINFSEKTVRRLIARGELPAIRPGGARGRIRVDQDDLEQWLAGQRTTTRGAA